MSVSGRISIIVYLIYFYILPDTSLIVTLRFAAYSKTSLEICSVCLGTSKIIFPFNSFPPLAMASALRSGFLITKKNAQ